MRMNMKSLCAVSCAVIALSGAALAVPIHPGDVVNQNGTTSAAEPWLAGPATDSVSQVPFTILNAGGNPVFTGVFTSEPGRSDIMGTIRIRYRLRDMVAVGDRRVVRVEILGFAGLQTNVEYRTDGIGDIGPNLASRTNGDGAQISFLFANPLLTPGLESHYFHVFSNGANYNLLGLARIVLNTGESVIIAGVYLPSLTNCPGDTNGDNIVNFADLNTVLTNYGEECD